MAEIRDAIWDDFEAVFGLLDARSRAASGISQEQPEYLRRRWELPANGKWVAVQDGVVVGYVGLAEDQDIVLTATDPNVGDALLVHAEREARERGFNHVASTAAPEDARLYSALQRNGYALEREILRMWRLLDGPLPEPVWTDGVTVRTYAEADGERVQALLDDAYAGWDANYVSRSRKGWLSLMTKHGDFDPALWFLVERDGALVACALQWKEHQRRGWVKDLAVRKSDRGRGLGQALLLHAFHAYAARGADRVGLKVDGTNPTGALQLYERLGFVTDQRLGIWTKRL